MSDTVADLKAVFEELEALRTYKVEIKKWIEETKSSASKNAALLREALRKIERLEAGQDKGLVLDCFDEDWLRENEATIEFRNRLGMKPKVTVKPRAKLKRSGTSLKEVVRGCSKRSAAPA